MDNVYHLLHTENNSDVLLHDKEVTSTNSNSTADLEGHPWIVLRMFSPAFLDLLNGAANMSVDFLSKEITEKVSKIFAQHEWAAHAFFSLSINSVLWHLSGNVNIPDDVGCPEARVANLKDNLFMTAVYAGQNYRGIFQIKHHFAVVKNAGYASAVASEVKQKKGFVADTGDTSKMLLHCVRDVWTGQTEFPIAPKIYSTAIALMELLETYISDRRIVDLATRLAIRNSFDQPSRCEQDADWAIGTWRYVKKFSRRTFQGYAADLSIDRFRKRGAWGKSWIMTGNLGTTEIFVSCSNGLAESLTLDIFGEKVPFVYAGFGTKYAADKMDSYIMKVVHSEI